MKLYPSEDIRNFAIVGHASSGKTMLAESIEAAAGAINRLGSIEAGTTMSDYHDAEKERQISINATPLCVEFGGKKLNFIDTPGYLDFMAEALGPLRVCDSALVVINATNGVEVGTTKVWDWSRELGVPHLVAVNGLDKEHVNFETALASLRENFGKKVMPLTVPMNVGPGFNQVMDVLNKKLVTFETDGSGKFTEEDCPEAEDLHTELIELIAESDDSLLEKFFEEGNLTEEELRSGLHKALQAEGLIPVFATSATTNVGVTCLMDFIARYGSSPADHPVSKAVTSDESETEINLTDKEPVLFIYKTMNEGHVGSQSFFKLHAGTLTHGADLKNTTHKSSERINQIHVLNGKDRVTVDTMSPGDLGALVKLKHTHTCDTLVGGKLDAALPPIEFPGANIHFALRSKGKGDEDKIAVGLAALHEEDPTFIYRVDGDLHQTVISGQGELHLKVICKRLEERYHVEIELSEPRVPLREAITIPAESKYRHKKQSGGAGQFAEVWIRIEPRERDSGVEFIESLVGQNVSRSFVPSVRKGVTQACTEGIIAGYGVVDVKVDFYDGKEHPVDSKDMAFQIAGKQAFREAFKAAKPCLLEPIMHVEIMVPEEFMGAVMGDLNSRRGKIQGMDTDGAFQVVKAHVPQMDLYKYSTNLRSLTEGRGLHTEALSHYENMPREMEQKVIASNQSNGEE
ncbi:MAG TPA: elongation factor G [Verrucomicrobiales bacterium]|nr:elongation factor G [Verrucomicrobiales bacterium]HIL24716.1 elongation factor G [Verrucomicrobiota bacterium]